MLEIVHTVTYYDRPIEGICVVFGSMYCYFVMQESIRVNKEDDYFSFTLLDTKTMFDLLTNKITTRDLMMRNRTFFGYWNTFNWIEKIPTKEQLPEQGQYYTKDYVRTDAYGFIVKDHT